MYNPIDVHVGKRIRFKRKVLGLTQYNVGTAVGLSFQQIQKYEKGENRVSASKLYELSKVLHTPVSFFFEDYVSENAPREFEKAVIGDKVALELLHSLSKINSIKVKKKIKSMINAMGAE